MKKICFMCQKEKEDIILGRKIPVCKHCQTTAKYNKQNIISFKRDRYSLLLNKLRKKEINIPKNCFYCKEKKSLLPIIENFDDIDKAIFFCDDCQNKWHNDFLHTVVGFDSITEIEEFKKNNIMGMINFTVVMERPSGVFITGLLKKESYNDFIVGGSRQK